MLEVLPQLNNYLQIVSTIHNTIYGSMFRDIKMHNVQKLKGWSSKCFIFYKQKVHIFEFVMLTMFNDRYSCYSLIIFSWKDSVHSTIKRMYVYPLVRGPWLKEVGPSNVCICTLSCGDRGWRRLDPQTSVFAPFQAGTVAEEGL